MADDQAQVQQENAVPHMKPILVLGLGGTGLDTIYRVRRRLLDRYGSLDRMPIVAFLWLDCDLGWEESARSHPDVALSPEHMVQPAERVNLAVSGATDLYNGIAAGNYPHLEWFSLARLRSFVNITAGAGNVRQLGRLCLFQHVNEVKSAITAQLDRINANEAREYVRDNYGTPTAPGLDIYLVCSLAGGTGSGIFLDVAYLCRHLVQSKADWSVVGFCLLASAFPGGNHQRKMANCYAALRECNYYSSHGAATGALSPLFANAGFDVRYGTDEASHVHFAGPPFDMCYMLDVTNTQGVQQKHDWLLNMLADYICLDFSIIGPFKRSKRQDVHRARGQQSDGAGMPAGFQSCGACALYFPAPQTREALAARLAQEVAASWFLRSARQVPREEGRGMKTDWPEEVVGETRAYILHHFAPANDLLQQQDDSGGVIEPMGLGPGGEPLVNQPAHWASSVLSRAVNENWPTNAGWVNTLEQIRQTEDEAYSTSGEPIQWGAFARQIATNADKLSRKLAEAIRNDVAKQVSDPAHGPDWAWCFLDRLKYALEQWAGDLERHARDASFIADQLGDFVLINETRRQGAGIPISSFIEEQRNKCLTRLNNLARQVVLIHKRQRMLADTEKYLRWASMYQRARVLELVRTQGARVLRRLCEVCDDLIVVLGQVRYVLGQAQEQAMRKAQATLDRVLTMPVAGDRLVNERLLDRLYADYVRQSPEADPTQITREVLDALGVSWLDLADRARNDSAILDRLAKELEQRCHQAVQEFAVPSGNRTTATGAVDILDLMYPSDAELRNQIVSAWDQSKPYAAHVAALTDGKWNPSEMLVHSLVGIYGGYLADDPDPERKRVLDVLENLGIPPGDISDNDDPATINFVHESCGLALRALTGVPEWRAAYLALSDKANDPPLHIVRDDMATRFPDIFPPDDSVASQAHFAVEVANCLGLLSEGSIREPDSTITIPLLCFLYTYPSGLTQEEQLARDLPSCKILLTQKDELRSRLLETIDRHVASADETRRTEIQERLKKFLDRALEAASGNTSEPAYRMLLDQVNDLASRHNLTLA